VSRLDQRSREIEGNKSKKEVIINMAKEIAVANTNNLQPLIENIVAAINEARRKVASHINFTMPQTYWQIGKYIVEYEQGGQAKVAYGTSTLTELSHQLTARFGRGFSRPNLVNMRKFYLLYPNCQTVSDILNWSHICELIKIDDALERSFYEKDIGIILSHYKDDLLVEYATYGLNTNLFVSKYELYLPDTEQLRKIVGRIVDSEETKDEDDNE